MSNEKPQSWDLTFGVQYLKINGQPESTSETTIRVVEHSAYQKAIEALKRECCCTGETSHIAPHKKILCDACETLRELGEIE